MAPPTDPNTDELIQQARTGDAKADEQLVSERIGAVGGQGYRGELTWRLTALAPAIA